jgi:hypothetical protein
MLFSELQISSLFHKFAIQYRAGDKIEKNEMVGACSTYGRTERCVQGFGGETWGKETVGETQA